MRKIMEVSCKPVLLLLFGILIVSAGFLIIGCGIGPQSKTGETEAGNFALDFTDCPIANECLVTFEKKVGSIPTIGQLNEPGREVTLEAWVKPKANANGNVLERSEPKKGVLLQVRATSTPNMVIPRFEIRRVQSDGTTTASYTVQGNLISLNSWTYIAGILTNTHSDNTGHPVCVDTNGNSDATIINDPWHMDFYQGTSAQDLAIPVACATTLNTSTDNTLPAAAFAHDPDGNTAAPGKFQGIIDEARIWNVNREDYLGTCMMRELEAGGGDCDLLNNMILYNRFNRGEGETVSDWSGTFGTGGKEYGIGNNLFEDWETGWTNDTPF